MNVFKYYPVICLKSLQFLEYGHISYIRVETYWVVETNLICKTLLINTFIIV